MLNKFFAAFFLTCCGYVSAMSPENGVWWNPNESGTGFNFEIQDNVLGVYAYTYEANGLPVYLYGGTTLTGTNQFEGTLNKSSNGSCISCPYRPNGQVQVGRIKIAFDSPSTATVTTTTAEGTRSTRVQRFAFLIDERSPYKMFGEWSLVTGSSSFPIYFGERLGFGTTFTGSNGALSASGSRTGSSSNVALARQEADGSWTMILDSSPSYYTFNTFRFSGLNTMEGRSWTYLKSATLSGSGLPFVGLRTGSKTSVVSGTGPALQKPGIIAPLPNYDDIDASKAQISATPSSDPAIMRTVESAQQAVREMLNR